VALPAVLGRYIVDLVAASRPTLPGAPAFIKEYVAWGAGTRASQNIALAAKSAAAQDGRGTASAADVRKAIVPVLRHRIGLSFRAEVDRIAVEEIIRRLVESVPEPKQ
ncbi:MAG: AAA family ATPase, partial [Planctomycetes bacterium]|nr:AAA family ATPase [Planctomycetota bacterium]